jgi:hypothetical protein
MPFSPCRTKLTIGSLDDSSLDVVAHYNPAQIELSRTVPWGPHNSDNRPDARRAQPTARDLEYTGGESRTYSLELTFDGFEKCESVRTHVDRLDQLATVQDASSTNEELRRPHQCVIVWGDRVDGFVPVRCVIDSLTVRYTMFSADGVPLRAVATIRVKEANVKSTVDTDAEGRLIASATQRGIAAGARLVEEEENRMTTAQRRREEARRRAV